MGMGLHGGQLQPSATADGLVEEVGCGATAVRRGSSSNGNGLRSWAVALSRGGGLHRRRVAARQMRAAVGSLSGAVVGVCTAVPGNPHPNSAGSRFHGPRCNGAWRGETPTPDDVLIALHGCFVPLFDSRAAGGCCVPCSPPPGGLWGLRRNHPFLADVCRVSRAWVFV